MRVLNVPLRIPDIVYSDIMHAGFKINALVRRKTLPWVVLTARSPRYPRS